MTSSSAAAASATPAAASPASPASAARPGTRPALRARGLTKSYDAPVLKDLDLDIEDGQFIAIMGPSGSGKSTLLHCLSGMDRPSGGSVLLGDTDIAALSERELAALRLSRFGFVFQQAHLLATLCLLDNIVLPGFLAGLRPRREVEARGRGLMERMGISELAGSDITEVSGGQLQRAGICRALINEPGIVFADEPTGALNSATAAQILDLLGEVHASGTTLVVVTHDAQVAARADRVLLLVDGGVVEDLALGGYREAQASQRLATVSQALQRRSV
ncbi:ABC transporter ATP-binding protein [Actinomyces israelii]|uniref:ABC transporter ATP-binding protein n=2 Tax=Actinomyces israelii TaxID=1659 RepID=UPI0005BDC8D0|nr:ABC transporter ATP-binding protein [Actinomyces israelii]